MRASQLLLFAMFTALVVRPDSARAAEPELGPSPPSQSLALAAAGEELPLPYGRFEGERHAPPPPLFIDEAPLPEPRARELARRPFELAAGASVTVPRCQDAVFGPDGCGGAGIGPGASLLVLYRGTPWFAAGLELGLTSRAGAAAPAADGRFASVAGRLYFANSGAFDPYLQLSLGYGSLEWRGESPDGVRVESVTGPLARVGAGVDVLFGTAFRLGPSLAFTQLAFQSERSCAGSRCASSLYGARILSFASFGLNATASFGSPL